MKSFQDILVRMFGRKNAYPINQITDAYNCFLKSQNVDVHHNEQLKKELRKSNYYQVIEEKSVWFGKIVRASKKENNDGMVLCYWGSQTRSFHKSKLKPTLI